jgi:phosphoribosyl-AMP cyclohydrolase
MSSKPTSSSAPSQRFAARGTKEDIEQAPLLQPKFDADGLIPAIVTDLETGEVLMFAWMNGEALARTIESRTAHFFSRSRNALWKKGEESGNLMRVEEMRVDCDQDVVWLRVRVGGDGVACHTGERSCFYRRVALGAAADAKTSLARDKT